MHESDPGIVAKAASGDIVDVAKAASGDMDAFRALVEQHSRYLFGVVFRLVRNTADAQDVVQNTWLKVHAQLGRFEARSEVRTWLTRIAVNCAIDFLRSSKRREAAYDPADLDDHAANINAFTPQPGADRLVLASEIEARVGQTMSCLTAVERAAFMLRHVEGMSISEIGSELGLKTSATKHCIFRAVRKMRAALAPFVQVRSAEALKVGE
jgi:RNA polymerase sigma-70 factor (ECF subfamily)